LVAPQEPETWWAILDSNQGLQPHEGFGPPPDKEELKQRIRERLELMRQAPPGEEANFDDITIGARVVVRIAQGEEELTTKGVLIITPPSANNTLGNVTDTSLEGQTVGAISW